MKTLDDVLSMRERRLLESLNSPIKIQSFLDKIPYAVDTSYHCPLEAIRNLQAHCFDGALLAAALLRRLGFPPLIVYLIADRDDDHLLALFKQNGCFGTVAKSNFVGLRFREPIYRNLRELVMSYFEQFYNIHREKTLRKYTVPLNLAAFDKWDWMVSNRPLERIAKRLDYIRSFPLLSRSIVGKLSPVDRLSYKAGMLGANRAGLFKPDVDEE